MSTTNREIADYIVVRVEARAASGYYKDAGSKARDELRKEISAALDAKDAERVPPKGHIIDDSGTVRKVLGTLPVTADGYIAGSDADLWWFDSTKFVQHVCVLPTTVSDCYSTRAAAEQAAKGAK